MYDKITQTPYVLLKRSNKPPNYRFLKLFMKKEKTMISCRWQINTYRVKPKV